MSEETRKVLLELKEKIEKRCADNFADYQKQQAPNQQNLRHYLVGAHDEDNWFLKALEEIKE